MSNNNMKIILENFRNFLKENEKDHEYTSQEALVEFIIPEWALPYLINGDDTGLNKVDKQKIDWFRIGVSKDHGNSKFLFDPTNKKDNLGYRRNNSIDQLGANCYRVYIKLDKNRFYVS